jgi:hypothetical protein
VDKGLLSVTETGGVPLKPDRGASTRTNEVWKRSALVKRSREQTTGI